MLPHYIYHPTLFFSITVGSALIIGPLAAYLAGKGFSQAQMPLLLISLCLPCITALVMIFGSHNGELIGDFYRRLLLFKISPSYLFFIVLLTPSVILLATTLSLFFGGSTDQFALNKEFAVMKGWPLLGVLIPLLLAPLIEEVGWRGYGVDSLRASFDLFTTSLIFGFLWALWHLPAFFIKGFYQNQIWYQNKLYALNFFASTFVVSFLMNWVYYKTNRSIPALILFHSMLNLSSVLLQTSQFTKCIATVLLTVISTILVRWDSLFFFMYP